jgi:hypothetical protein
MPFQEFSELEEIGVVGGNGEPGEAFFDLQVGGKAGEEFFVLH